MGYIEMGRQKDTGRDTETDIYIRGRGGETERGIGRNRDRDTEKQGDCETGDIEKGR